MIYNFIFIPSSHQSSLPPFPFPLFSSYPPLSPFSFLPSSLAASSLPKTIRDEYRNRTKR
jgi:hypothetical protein